MSAPLLQWFIMTHQGNFRDANEDSVRAYPDYEILQQRPTEQPVGGRICVVADGMGGHRGGKQASQIAVHRIIHLYYTLLQNLPIDQALFAALRQTSDDIAHAAQEDPNLQGMGTTVVAATIFNAHAYIANVGDSRAYLWRRGTLQLLSFDDRWVAQQMRDHVLTEEQARNHEHRNLLTQYLGNPEGVHPHTTDKPIPVFPEDRLLLCTDGLFEVVSDKELQTILAGPPEGVPHQLIQLALDRETTDNVTVAVGYYGPLRPTIQPQIPVQRDLISTIAGWLGIRAKILLIIAPILALAMVLMLCVVPTLVIGRASNGTPSETEPTNTTTSVRIVAKPTAIPTPSPLPRLTSTIEPTNTPTPSPTPTETPTPIPTSELPDGWRESDGWAYYLPKGYSPGPVLNIDGNSGRFFLIIVQVRNRTGQEQPVPLDFFAMKDMKDEQERTYEPVHISNNKCNADLPMDAPIPADDTVRSVCIIFNVAEDATDLTFFVRNNPEHSWPIDY